MFEALVNAVVHRDYSMRGSKIRPPMFDDRLEIQSPGSLPNNLFVENMSLRQSTRNEALTSVLARMSVEPVVVKTGNISWRAAVMAPLLSGVRHGNFAESIPSTGWSTIRRFFLLFLQRCRTRVLPVLSSPGYAAYLEQDWTPSEWALAVDLDALPKGGSVIFAEATGDLPVEGQVESHPRYS